MARGKTLTQKQLQVMQESFIEYPNYTNKRIAQKLKTSDSTISRYRDMFPKLEEEVEQAQETVTAKQSTLFDTVPDVHVSRVNVGVSAISTMFDHELMLLDSGMRYEHLNHNQKEHER